MKELDIKGSGTVGVITYLRTDLPQVISEEADVAARAYIGESYGKEYVIASQKKTEKGEDPGCPWRRSDPDISRTSMIKDPFQEISSVCIS